MKALVEKVAALLPELSDFGRIYLLGLFEQEESPGKWDVLFSSDRSDSEAAQAIRAISDKLVPQLKKTELAAISRIVVIPSTEPSISALASSVSVAGGSVEVRDCNFMGLQIRHAYLVQTQRPPSPAVGPARIAGMP